VISQSGPVKDLDGNVIADPFGRPGFPNAFSPLATQSLGYAVAMLEAGVQVVYISPMRMTTALVRGPSVPAKPAMSPS